MGRLFGFIIFLFLLLVGIWWSHIFAKQGWDSSASVMNKVGTNKTTISPPTTSLDENPITDPLRESRELHSQALKLWESDEDKDLAIEKLENSIGSVESIEEDHEDFYNSNESEVIDWRAKLQKTLQEWKSSTSLNQQSEPNNFNSVTGSGESQLSSTASTVSQATDLVSKKTSVIAGTPPPPIQREKEVVEEPLVIEEHPTDLDFNIDKSNKDEMWTIGFNEFEAGEDYLIKGKPELAIIAFQKSKLYYDALHEGYPEYQNEFVNNKLKDLSKKIYDLRKIY